VKIGCCIAALVLSGSIAFARIGETAAQIEKRYGKPISSSPWTNAYLYNDLFIIVTFDDGISALETYEKRNSAPMTAGEIRHLLKTNGGGAKWDEPSRNGFEVHYKATGRSGEYNTVANTLTVADYTALRRIIARNQALDAHKLKGL
jgi:hypothetical protein